MVFILIVVTFIGNFMAIMLILNYTFQRAAIK